MFKHGLDDHFNSNYLGLGAHPSQSEPSFRFNTGSQFRRDHRVAGLHDDIINKLGVDSDLHNHIHDPTF